MTSLNSTGNASIVRISAVFNNDDGVGFVCVEAVSNNCLMRADAPIAFWISPITSLIVAVCTIVLLVVFYRVLTLSSFDAGLAASFGYRPGVVHYLLMAVLSVVVVAAFEAVGAILVIALLIMPGATAYLCTHRLKMMLFLSAVHAGISSILGVYISIWFNGKASAGVVIAGTLLFLLAWMFGPADGVIVKAIHRRIKSPV